MTYVEAISEIQKRSVEALKVVQSTQIASLRATRDLAAALAVPPLALWMACAKNMAETLGAPQRPLDEPLAQAAAALPDVPVLVGPVLVPEASLDIAAKPELVIEPLAAELDQAGDTALPLLSEASAATLESVESHVLAPPVEIVAEAETLEAPEVHAVEPAAAADTQPAAAPSKPLPPLKTPAPKTTAKKKTSATANNRARSERGPS
jgi:hypothetical protein